MSYLEHPPVATLMPWVACIWERCAQDVSPVRVLPDGCIDVVWIAGAGAQLVGANRTAFLVSLAPGTRVVGARLRPGCAPSLLGIGGESVCDARVPLADVWADEGARLSAALDASEDQVAVLEAALLARARSAERPDPLVQAAVARMEGPDVVVADLADELGVSQRQLRRRVGGAVGYGPKRLARVLRLGRALGAARAGGDLARVAYEAGYADQAHFANDCHALAGVAPSIVIAA
ncbi:MAG: helix-turn-helix domain-containing protein [Solirubrobacteraceae bacterium]